mmetsp:Transcript_12680/g.17304  ORF Transcript_12680/g.17304 Transcript_12680/m.17304 type:complete len:99 (+) Transcript_12680:420-716(+)
MRSACITSFLRCVNIATLVKRAHKLKDECKELTQRLEQLREIQRHNNKYSPLVLFRLIEDLRKELISQREETAAFRIALEERTRTRKDYVKTSEEEKN